MTYMTVDELADKLREAMRNAPDGETTIAYLLFGMKYKDHLGRGAASIRDVCELAQVVVSTAETRIQHGRQLAQSGYLTLNEDALWF